MTDLPPSFPDAATRGVVQALLSSAEYREDNLLGRLDLPPGSSVSSAGAAALRQALRDTPSPLKEVMQLFLLGDRLESDRTVRALGEKTVEALHATGLVQKDGDLLRATAHLATIGELVIATDLSERHRNHEADFVLGPGGVTRRLAELTVRDPVESVLDLGCGAGVLAGLAASHASRVVATDVNARAVRFSAFNAELNGCDNMEAREGSLFEPVKGERFDLIVCNPPYVISPSETFVYRDGGTDLCRRIVREATAYLTENGTLQMMAEWPQRDGGDWRGELASWFADPGYDAWVLRFYSQNAREYAGIWLRQEYPAGDVPEGELGRWIEHLQGLDIDSVGGGLIVLRPARGMRPIREIRDAPPVTAGPCGESLAHWLAAQTLLSRLPSGPDILDVLLVPSPDLERRTEQRPTGNGWTHTKPQLRLHAGLRFGARVDPVAAEIVGRLDGVRTPREALRHFAAEHGVSEEPFLSGLPAALRRLLALGLLIPAAEED